MDIHDFIKGLVQKLFFTLNKSIGLESSLAGYLSELISLVMLFLVSYLVYKITVRLMWGIIIPVLKKSKNQFDDFLVKHHFFRNLAYVVPAFIIYYFVGWILINHWLRLFSYNTGWVKTHPTLLKALLT